MIHHIKGKLTEKSPTHVVIECGGVGYFLNISLNSYDQISNDENCMLLAYLSVKEDSHTLYGFTTDAERQLFLLLISVAGVGPNTARLILSSHSPQEISQAILSENEALLTRIKGLGPKTVKRLILELKDKVGKVQVGGEILTGKNNTIKNEALSGLLVLGFDKKKAESSIDSLLKMNSDLSVEELIKAAIKTLY